MSTVAQKYIETFFLLQNNNNNNNNKKMKENTGSCSCAGFLSQKEESGERRGTKKSYNLSSNQYYAAILPVQQVNKKNKAKQKQ